MRVRCKGDVALLCVFALVLLVLVSSYAFLSSWDVAQSPWGTTSNDVKSPSVNTVGRTGRNRHPTAAVVPPSGNRRDAPGDSSSYTTRHHSQLRKPCDPCQSACYSSFRCIEGNEDVGRGGPPFNGREDVFGFAIVNRTCAFYDLVFEGGDPPSFVFHAPSAEVAASIPGVSLASRAYDLPIRHYKRVIVKKKLRWTMPWKPRAVVGKIACGVKDDPRRLAYYSPIVAPWNFAHTLLCDLFGLFWGAHELGEPTDDLQVVAVSKLFHPPEFLLPHPTKPNRAFDWFSRLPPVYDYTLPQGTRFASLIAGTGTKTWSWVTKRYSASGSVEMWQAFRQHVLRVVGLEGEEKQIVRSKQKSTAQDGKKVRVSICHKKDKRGAANYEETVSFLQTHFSDTAEFVLETGAGKSAKEQVRMMLDADIFMCNEGTLATSFFMMRPGTAFLSIPLVYHTPQLHIMDMPPAATWWREPDPVRPDPRKNTGGNIDWFPPAIPWVKTFWYYTIPMNETKIVLPLQNLQMPEFNIVLSRERVVPLMAQVIDFIRQGPKRTSPGSSSGDEENPTGSVVATSAGKPPLVRERPPNYSINADLCRLMLERRPAMVDSFNTARCYFGMSWLCEFWVNTAPRWRMLHEKWTLSKGRCGDGGMHPAAMGLRDPREDLPLDHFLFYTRAYAQTRYGATDLKLSNASVPELDAVFGANPSPLPSGGGVDDAETIAASSSQSKVPSEIDAAGPDPPEQTPTAAAGEDSPTSSSHPIGGSGDGQ